VPTDKTRESKVEKEICSYAESRGWWVGKFVSPGRKGVMDRVMIRNGKVIWPEIKRPGEEEDEHQVMRREEMEAHGARCYVWHSLTEAIGVLY
jgi:hypothetical protein